MPRIVRITLCVCAALLVSHENVLPEVSGFGMPLSSSSWSSLPFGVKCANNVAKQPTASRHSITPPPRATLRLQATVPGSSLEVIEPETGVAVTLLGCFHGSKSSAMDVSTCMMTAGNNDSDDDETQVVVLELCASRFDDMRRDMEREATGSTMTPKPWIVRFFNMVVKTIQTRGLSTGLAAALLGGVSGMQTSLSGLEPGLEFRTAVRYVQEQAAANDDKTSSCDIVLADQNVEETLDKVGQLLSISIELWRTFLKEGWEASFGRESDALAQAVMGASSKDNNDDDAASLNLYNFCTRSPESVRDMMRLLVPPVLMLQTIVVVMNQGMAWLQTVDGLDAELIQALTADAAADSLTLADSVALFAVNLLILVLGYLSVALPAARVILRERDDCLTHGIREACRVAAKKAGQGKRGRVVAVLGLLHVNGIAERLRNAGSEGEIAESQV